ncbi:sensor histidine kinase [Listeria ilorinensis]|uniref:sensor histidine kinase n=1 Tax=Listeria ilorinensis TaxID=2867439 RepID=UPI001EF469BD|nr:GHKL domain-containing protein [Listeria ilorinensis]
MGPSILGVFAQIFILFLLIEILTGKLLNWKEGLTAVFFCTIVVIPLFFYIGYWANLVVIGVYVLILFLIKKKSLAYAMTIPLLGYVFLVIGDYICNAITVQWLKLFDMSGVTQTYHVVLMYMFVDMCVSVALAYLTSKLAKKFSIDALINQKKYGLIITATILFTLVIFYINIYFGSLSGFDVEVLKFNTILFTLYLAGLMGILFLVIQTAIKELKMKNQREQLEQLQEYTATLESLHKEMRVFRHDYINIISTLAGYIEENDMTGLKNYFDKNIVPINQTIESNNYKISLLQNIHITELKGLIAIKLIRAQELKIDAILEVVEDISEINMPSVDLCKVVGILLDNAVEAALESKNKTIRLAVVKKQDSTLIVFANSIPDNMPPIYKIFEEGFSTKGSDRGLGLASLRDTLQNHPNVALDTKVTDREFIQELEIM